MAPLFRGFERSNFMQYIFVYNKNYNDGSSHLTPIFFLDEDGCYDITSLTTENMHRLVKDDRSYLVSVSGELGVGFNEEDPDESDDVFDISFLYGKYEKLMRNRVIDSLILVDGIDNDEQKRIKKSFNDFVSEQLSTYGINIKMFDKVLAERYDMDRRGNKFFFDKIKLLTNKNLTARCDDSTKDAIQDFIDDNDLGFKNEILRNENQEVIFYACDDGIMPTYEDVRRVVDSGSNSIYYSEMKNLVPAYFKYIGGYANYSKISGGGVETDANDRYVQKKGGYFTDGFVAAITNDYKYTKILKEYEKMYSFVKVGDKNMSITSEFITGSSEYDDDAIRENEKEYYDALCSFMDECIEKDILNAPIRDWMPLGINLEKIIPGVRESSSFPLNKISVDTLKSARSKDEKTFTLKDLEKYGVSKKTFVDAGKGSPTANAWFRYAINLALIATRAYSGKVGIPFGYDACDFCRSIESTGISFTEKYNAITSDDPSVYERGSRRVLRRLSDISITDRDGNDIDVSDYSDIASDIGNDYWYPEVGVYSKNRQTEYMKLNLIIDTDCDTGGMQELYEYQSNSIARLTEDGKRSSVKDLTDVIYNYCLNSSNLYAFPEALIKLLRFGNNKPKNLQISGEGSKINLSSSVVQKNICRDKPILIDGKYKYVVKNIVVASSLSNELLEYLKSKSSANTFNKFVIGVKLASAYDSGEPDEPDRVYEFVDIQTLVTDYELQSEIYGDILNADINDDIEEITVSSVLEDIKVDTIRNSARQNSVMLESIKHELDEVQESSPRSYKVLTNLNKEGFNIFSLFAYMETAKSPATPLGIIQRDNKDSFIKDAGSVSDIINIMYYGAFYELGGVFVELMSKKYTSVKDALKNAIDAWSNKINTKLQLSSVVVSSPVNEVKEYAELIKNNVDLTMSYMVLTVWAKNPVGEEERKFFALSYKKNEKSTRFIILSGTKTSDVFISEVAKASNTKINKITMHQFDQRLKVAQKKFEDIGKSVTLETMIDSWFTFIDNVTKNEFMTELKRLG